jgi:methanogenic corrinoid protein MtbC1
MLIAAKTMKKGVEILKPKLGSGATSKLGKCIIGTVQGRLARHRQKPCGADDRKHRF